MVPNETDLTTEEILSVRNRYTTNIFRFIENFVSLDFWSKIKKNSHVIHDMHLACKQNGERVPSTKGV